MLVTLVEVYRINGKLMDTNVCQWHPPTLIHIKQLNDVIRQIAEAASLNAKTFGPLPPKFCPVYWHAREDTPYPIRFNDSDFQATTSNAV